jgi:hypothetical protein
MYIELDRRVLSALCLVSTVALGLALPGDGRSPLASGAEPGPPSPAALAGRYERASAPGGYVDVHGPFNLAEERLVAGYRDAAGRPFDAPRSEVPGEPRDKSAQSSL